MSASWSMWVMCRECGPRPAARLARELRRRAPRSSHRLSGAVCRLPTAAVMTVRTRSQARPVPRRKPRVHDHGCRFQTGMWLVPTALAAQSPRPLPTRPAKTSLSPWPGAHVVASVSRFVGPCHRRLIELRRVGGVVGGVRMTSWELPWAIAADGLLIHSGSRDRVGSASWRCQGAIASLGHQQA